MFLMSNSETKQLTTEEIVEKVNSMPKFTKVRMHSVFQEQMEKHKEQKPIYDYIESSKGTFVDEIFELEGVHIVRATNGPVDNKKVVYYAFIDLKCTKKLWYSFEEALFDAFVTKYQGDNNSYVEAICRMLQIPMLDEPKNAKAKS
jgi:hypothetical protein